MGLPASYLSCLAKEWQESGGTSPELVSHLCGTILGEIHHLLSLRFSRLKLDDH